jgi:hypothetical protein
MIMADQVRASSCALRVRALVNQHRTQDHDGSHIKGLVINMIHKLWPSLLKVDGFLQVCAACRACATAS